MTRGAIVRILLGLALVFVLGVGGVWRSLYIESPARWGETMGTSYSIRISGKIRKSDLKNVSRLIEDELREINRQMSTWDPESEISRFNHSESLEPIIVSRDFAEVVERALAFSASTGGAFDSTLQPLLNLWGFGSEGKELRVPSDAEIATTKAMTGWQKIAVEKPSSLRKSEPGASLDLGAIAKGYGVDALARILEENGYENWFVEIGGEVVVMGLNAEGNPWRVGIQYPSTDPMEDRRQGILHITGGAIATSGDYRNYIQLNNTIYSHILDPRSGRTVLSDTASVTVHAPNCTDADGIATALFVMGPDEGMEWVEQRPGVEALFLLRDGNGEIFEKFSSGFVESTGYDATH